MLTYLTPNGGQVDEKTIGLTEQEQRDALKLTEEIQKRQSPEGKLGLSEYLDKRRLEFGIIDGHFEADCMFDRIHVFQIPYVESMFYPGTNIRRPDDFMEQDRQTANRGIIISAGLLALEDFTSNGGELGDIVHFCKHAPNREAHHQVPGKHENLMILRIGDLTSNEDLRRRTLSGETKVKSVSDPKFGYVLVYEDRDGKQLRPKLPWMPADF